MAYLRRLYAATDPRTLGLVRIAVALLLLTDLVKRCTLLRTFYTNAGLLPNHRALWRPAREVQFSFLFSLSERHEVTLAFILIGAVYMCFLIGYRTRLMHVLSWLSLISLELRVDLLANGADFVFSDLVLWTAFLPLGRRLSVDALRASMRESHERNLDELRASAGAPRDTAPVVSLAVLAATLQLCVIYFFNTIHKSGSTWRSGSAVYYMLHQERIVTSLGLWVREHAPYLLLQGLTYGTLVIEGALPLLILSPWGRPWTRRAAIVGVFALHGSIALLSNLGLFSPVMMAFALLMVDARDWDALAARARRGKLQLVVDSTSGLGWQFARLVARLDSEQRIEITSSPASGVAFALVDEHRRPVKSVPAACAKLVGALPLGPLVAPLGWPLWVLLTPALRWACRNRAAISNYFDLAPASVPEHTGAPLMAADAQLGSRRASAFRRHLGVTARRLREAGVAALMVVAVSQVLNENPAVPNFLKHEQPRVIRNAVDYFRLNQGWSMFAPDAPTSDRWVVVDGETVSGKHVDPFNRQASRVADPSLRKIPERLEQSAAYCDYTVRIPEAEIYHDPLRAWILRYHRRTRDPRDQIVHFKAYAIEQDSPAPTERAPRNVRAWIFLSD